jgi:hypothetical protein
MMSYSNLRRRHPPEKLMIAILRERNPKPLFAVKASQLREVWSKEKKQILHIRRTRNQEMEWMSTRES